VKVSSRAAAAAADKSKRQTPVMPASQPSTKNDAQPSQKPPKKYVSVSYASLITLIVMCFFRVL